MSPWPMMLLRGIWVAFDEACEQVEQGVDLGGGEGLSPLLSSGMPTKRGVEVGLPAPVGNPSVPRPPALVDQLVGVGRRGR